MFRVIYRWQVIPSNFDEFRKSWKITTNKIHRSVAGARGSFMLRSSEKESEILTVAKWDSKESWLAFWGESNPEEMLQMRRLGTRISVETYDEIEDQSYSVVQR